MKREMVSFRMDITFWLAILVLAVTLLSRHLGRMMPTNLNFPLGTEKYSQIIETK